MTPRKTKTNRNTKTSLTVSSGFRREIHGKCQSLGWRSAEAYLRHVLTQNDQLQAELTKLRGN
jgi:hypothetical protein